MAFSLPPTPARSSPTVVSDKVYLITIDNRLLVFARRAAPVQVTWLGFMNTLGMKGMDYRLTDGSTDPVGHEAFYSEKLFRLECMASYVPPAHAPLRRAGAAPRTGRCRSRPRH